MKSSLIVATRNTDKLREIQAALADLPLNITSLIDYPDIPEIAETGSTFTENALIKARAVAKLKHSLVLADDSGIECEDLHGAPGIYSARFAGPAASDLENNDEMIRRLKEIHDPTRRARYVCVFVLIEAQSAKEMIIIDTCEGYITFTPGGTGGFGYDPYFYLPEFRMTMAELPLATKNQLSHRGKALQKLRHHLLAPHG